jgi:hypothetical protein
MCERVVYKACTILVQNVSIYIYNKEKHEKCRKVTYVYDLKEFSFLQSFYTSIFSVEKRGKNRRNERQQLHIMMIFINIYRNQNGGFLHVFTVF